MADVLTKALPKAKYVWCTYNFGIRKGGLHWGQNEASSSQASNPHISSSRVVTPMSRRKLMKLEEEEEEETTYIKFSGSVKIRN